MLGVALARSASGQRWPEPGEAVNLIVSGIGERLGGMLPRPDQRDTASVLAIAGPVLLAATAGRTIAGRFMYTPAIIDFVTPHRIVVTGIAIAAWWTLVALAGMLGWRRAAAAGACLGLAGQVVMLVLAVAGYSGPLMVSYWQAVVALVAAVSALGSLRGQGRPLSWWAVTALAAAAAILAGWPAVEVAFVTYTPITANSGTISDPLGGIAGWLNDGLFAATLILMAAAIAALRPAVRRRAAVLLLPAFVTTALACWGFRGFLPGGLPLGLLMLSPLQWQDSGAGTSYRRGRLLHRPAALRTPAPSPRGRKGRLTPAVMAAERRRRTRCPRDRRGYPTRSPRRGRGPSSLPG